MATGILALRSLRDGIVLVSLASLWVACGSPQEKPSQPKIYGGQKVTRGAWPSTVALTDSSGIYCTGTAVTPELVITAAHCLDGQSEADLSVYTGPGRANGAVEGQYPVSWLNYSPLYSPYDPDSDHDVGYLILSQPLDLPASAYVPIALAASEIRELVAIGQSTRIVGYGERESGAYGVKYQATSSITEVGRTEISIGGDGTDSCYGDSGGPAYGQLSSGEWRVYGVVSRGGTCGEGGIWGLMHASACWIEEDSGIDLGVPSALCQL